MKITPTLLKRWKAKENLYKRGITHLNTDQQKYYDLVTEEAKKFDFECDSFDNLMETKEEIVARLEDEDTVRIT